MQDRLPYVKLEVFGRNCMPQYMQASLTNSAQIADAQPRSEVFASWPVEQCMAEPYVWLIVSVHMLREMPKL